VSHVGVVRPLRARDTPVFGKAPIVPPVRLSGDQIIPCWKPYGLTDRWMRRNRTR
jgi:hypothetical protein